MPTYSMPAPRLELSCKSCFTGCSTGCHWSLAWMCSFLTHRIVHLHAFAVLISRGFLLKLRIGFSVTLLEVLLVSCIGKRFGTSWCVHRVCECWSFREYLDCAYASVWIESIQSRETWDGIRSVVMRLIRVCGCRASDGVTKRNLGLRACGLCDSRPLVPCCSKVTMSSSLSFFFMCCLFFGYSISSIWCGVFHIRDAIHSLYGVFSRRNSSSFVTFFFE
jgi:hypothetical protein